MNMRVILVATVLLASGCKDQRTTPVVAETENMPADQILYDLKHNMTTEGIRTAVLHGDTAYVRDAGETLDLVGVRLVFFDSQGRENGQLTARNGEYNSTTGAMIARGDVVLVTNGPQGERELRTEELHYEIQADRMWSNVPVELREGGRIVKGTELQADARFQNVRIGQARTAGTPIDSGAEGGLVF